ncbi:ABC transporter ATP-binding protein [Candidatus Berkiella cookevillensis]|uniref:ABC-type dipeptide transporter n=1 Tax=Candidatus Berkiella cookevillensis TaxID=437022 RepID=A0A0Q9YTJ9_9GAMM|nr:ABC transporter ATP-binding protein [Candidatus Berkiella cookevillensis]MCS5708249.1 ABC transporter ATP-binding protein [Candidatus Berkiella cookevillensis]
MKAESILRLKNLQVRLRVKNGWVYAVDGVNLSINAGEIFALVGESGCGKSMTAMAITRLLPTNASMMEGSELWLDDIPLHQLSEYEMKKIRSKKIGFIFQDPMASLNPVLTIGEQIIEAIAYESNHKLKYTEMREQAYTLLSQVRIPDPKRIFKEYPHQLSGGMKQRVVIAMALAKKPDLLIADEPTTALDVTTQAQVLHLIQSLNQMHHMAILLITHDLGVVSQMADKVAVMYAGHIIEQSSAETFFVQTLHPYSQKLLKALPEKTNKNESLAVIPGQVPSLNKPFSLCRFKSRCSVQFKACEESMPNWLMLDNKQQVRCHWYDTELLKKYPKNFRIDQFKKEEMTVSIDENLYEPAMDEKPFIELSGFKVYYPIRKGIFKRTVGHVRAVDGIALSLHEGQTLALVGESGCGKTSVGKAIIRLTEPEGKFIFDGIDFLRLSGSRLRKKRADMQMIFQDPFSSMNPKMRVHDILEEGMLSLKVGSNKQEREDRINVLLEQVGLMPEMKWRYPFEFSGGQRQRIAIARALSVGPKLIVCDEPTSALDVSVQAQILNLLKNLQYELGMSYLFITHNLNVVRYIAHHVAVMYLGKIVEYGTVDKVLNQPKHPYTQALIDAIPSISHAQKGFQPPKGEIPSALNPPQGCHFAPRCPHKMSICESAYPGEYNPDHKQMVRCYLYENEAIAEKTNGQSV